MYKKPLLLPFFLFHFSSTPSTLSLQQIIVYIPESPCSDSTGSRDYQPL